MSRKRDVSRPYAPDYCSAETLAYRLDMSRDTLDANVKSGLLPPPEEVGTQRRWYWPTVRTWIEAKNGKIDGVDQVPVPSGEPSPFTEGAKRVKAAHA